MLKKQLVMVADPVQTSMAALVMLSRDLEKAQRRQWLDFRDELLDDAEAADGQLVCKLCGMEGMLRETPEGKFRQPANLATIDHIVPRSKGGPEYDKKNCMIVCYGCNQRKKDKMPHKHKW